MLEELTCEQYLEQRAFDIIEPLGTEWLARALCLLMTPHLSEESNATVDDFMEALGFRPYEPPVDGKASEAAIIAGMGAI